MSDLSIRTWLAAAARREANLCVQKLPALVASNKLPAEAAQVTFQAWSIVARWLETGCFESVMGGAKGDTKVSWAECDLVVQGAAAKLLSAAAALEQPIAGEADDVRRGQLIAKRQRLLDRAGEVDAIARRVANGRQLIDSINQGFADRRRDLGLKAA